METIWADIRQAFANPFMMTFGIMLGSILAAWLVEFILNRTLLQAAARTKTDLDDKLIEALRRPIFLSVLFYGLTWAIEPLGFPARVDWVVLSVIETLTVLVWTGASFRVGGLFLELLSSRAGEGSILQQRTLPLFNMLLKGATFAIAVYFVFLAWDVDVTAWLASAGIIGLAVGFAAQDSLANLFAGIFIIADAPYKIDDFIVLDNGTRGRVTKIGVRSTRILTLDDVEITIPNSVMGSSSILNEAGGPSLKQRVAVAVDAAYGSDVDKVREVLLACVAGVRGIADLPTPKTRFKAFGASGLSFELHVWVEDPQQRDAILDTLHERVYKAMNQHGLEIPYSKHDLYLKEIPQALQRRVE